MLIKPYHNYVYIHIIILLVYIIDISIYIIVYKLYYICMYLIIYVYVYNNNIERGFSYAMINDHNLTHCNIIILADL